MKDKKEEELEESERGSRSRQKEEEAMEGLLLTSKMMCFEGGAPSSTRDLVIWP